MPFQWAFSGISTFAHLKHVKCLSAPYEPFDIGIIGAPFDTAVSYRPGKCNHSSASIALSKSRPELYDAVRLPVWRGVNTSAWPPTSSPHHLHLTLQHSIHIESVN